MEHNKSEEKEDEMAGGGEEMNEQGGPWMKHGMRNLGKIGRSWKKCGCPMCQWMRTMHRMSMMGGMMPGMGMGMMRGMRMQGVLGMAPWRRFVSSDEKIASLEKYLKDLQLEEKAVQEKIDQIRSRYQK